MPTLDDFEGGIAGWTAEGDVVLSVETTEVHSGSQSLKIAAGETTGFGDAVGPIMNLAPGWYKFSGWAKAIGANGYVYMQLRPGQNRNNYHISTTAWQKFEDYYYVASNDDIQFSLRVYGSQHAYIDDITYEPVTQAVLPSEGEPNSGYLFNFEQSAEQAHTGTYSYKSMPGATWPYANPIAFYAPTKAGFDATLTAWVYSPTGSPDAALGVISWVTETEISDTSTVKDAWEQLSITVPQEEMAYDAWWDGDGIGPVTADGPIYADDLVVTWTPRSEAIIHYNDFEHFDVGDIYVSNKSPDYWYWKQDGDEVIEVVDTFSHTGTKSLHAVFAASANPNLGQRPAMGMYVEIYWAMTAAPYEISCWVYVAPGSAPVALQVRNDRSPGNGNTILVSDATTSTGAWEKLTINLSQYDFEYTGYYDAYVGPTDGSAAEFWVDEFTAKQLPALMRLDLDVDLTGSLATSLPVPDGALDVVIDAEAVPGVDKLNAEGQFDIVVTVEPVMPAMTLYVAGSVSVPMDVSAAPLFTGLDLLPTGEIDAGVSPEAAINFNITFLPQGWDLGGYWGNGYLYQSSPYIAPNQFNQAFSSSIRYPSDSTGCYKYTLPAQTSPNQAWLALLPTPYGNRLVANGPTQVIPWQFGMDLTMSVWVYVETAGVTFSLGARWFNEASGNQAHSIESAASWTYADLPGWVSTTSTGVWQQLTYTIPGSYTSKMRDLPSFVLMPSNHSISKVVYLDSLQYTWSGSPSGYGYNDMESYGPYSQWSFNSIGFPGVETTYGATGYGWGRSDSYGEGDSGYLIEPNYPVVNKRIGTAEEISTINRLSVYGTDNATNPVSLKITYRVKVPSGNPDLKLAQYFSIWNLDPGYPNWTGYTWPISNVATTSVKDEWVDLSVVVWPDMYQCLQNGFSAATIYPNKTYSAPIALTMDGLGVFFVDEARYEYVYGVQPRVYVSSNDHVSPVKNVVDFTGTLFNLDVSVAGSVDIDIDMESFVPYEESVSGSINTGVSTVLGQSGRYYAFARPGTLTSWDWFGFEGNVYRYENEGDYWWDEQFYKEGDTDSYPWYRLGGWTPPTGGAQDSQVCLMYVMPAWYPTTPGGEVTSYHAAYVDTPMGKKMFGLRVCVWVYNTDPNVPLTVKFANDSAWLPDYSDFAQIFGTAQTTKTGEWEMMVCDIPADTIWQNSNRNGITTLHYVTVVVYGSDPRRRHTFYVDNLDYYWYLDDSSATTSIASI